MHEPPVGVDPDELIMLIRRTWEESADDVQHLPVGFGAHHWRATAAGEPRAFVTLDRPTDPAAIGRLRQAYTAAAAVGELGLEFVVAPRRPVAVPFADGVVTTTGWVDGTAVGDHDPAVTAAILHQLHAVDPRSLGVPVPRWHPVVRPDFADVMRASTQAPWDRGPHGTTARTAMIAAGTDLDRWTDRHLALAARATGRRWVITHGEPGAHNQMITDMGIRLVDWVTLALAPAERDLRALGEGDPEMLELFDLEWRLSEIDCYVRWFAGPHGDGADDRDALADLLHELARP